MNGRENRPVLRWVVFVAGGGLGIGVVNLLLARQWGWAGVAGLASLLVTLGCYAQARWGKDESGPV